MSISTQSDTWRFFDQNPLTHSAAHYLMTIHELKSEHGYARLTDISRHLQISAGSCSTSLKVLKKKGLITDDQNKFWSLTPKGERLTNFVERNDQLLTTLLHDLLGVDLWQAEVDACKMEHLLSFETSLKLARFVEFLTSDEALAMQVREHIGQLPMPDYDDLRDPAEE